MKKKYLFPLFALLLVGCKTGDMYVKNAYNSPNFDENYYLTYDASGVKEDVVSSVPVVPAYTINQDNNTFKDYGYENCLSKKDEKFKKGILSKLYDGRTRCDSYYQLSRVQVDKTGFGTRLPVTISQATKFEFALRGGTSRTSSLRRNDLKFNFTIDLVYTEDGAKNWKSYSLENVPVHTDNDSNTTFISIEFEKQLQGISYYQFKFTCEDPTLPADCTDDYSVKEKDHLAIMLYEVLIN